MQLSGANCHLIRLGNVRCQEKTPDCEGSTYVIVEPPDYMARLTALVPKPRINFIRLHWVFAPNSPCRAQVTRANRGRASMTGTGINGGAHTGTSRWDTP